MNRRAFFRASALASGALLISNEADSAAATMRGSFIDVNVSLSRWPLRRLPCDEPERLVARLRSRGVTLAWAGTFDGLLQKDVGAANKRLAEDCRRFGKGLLLPFGSINPVLPGWVGEMHRCAREYRMRGVRLHPNYHGYALDDPRCERVLELARELNLIVQLAVLMEDERMMHPRLRVEPVNIEPLPAIVRNVPGVRVVLLNALGTVRGAILSKVLASGDVSVEMATLEGVGGLENLLSTVPAKRVLFGSHAPLYYFEAAELKLKESALSAHQSQAIRFENAQQLLA